MHKRPPDRETLRGHLSSNLHIDVWVSMNEYTVASSRFHERNRVPRGSARRNGTLESYPQLLARQRLDQNQLSLPSQPPIFPAFPIGSLFVKASEMC